ncbi:stage II sporulation protein M [Gottschalkia purinilytica]|uniref:Stage II sporulation protein M n=1 Tax=Gottschalkia purinilytica TaxID=1503 RepID=A0A0L0W7H6_GOTPU|nr:stage II sporulation protein M [Gottschalkia purinilytica]KNF07421.1 stage II sporulation protein M [Gottschalkia purinilytica]
MKITENLKKHIRDNIILYFILVLSLMIGIASGAITINMLNPTQKKELIDFLNSFFRVLNTNIDNSVLLKHSLENNIYIFLIVLILGISIIGGPLILGVVLLRGFIIGFTVGFLVKEVGMKGVLFSTLVIVPQNIFIIPWILIASAISLCFSLRIIKNKFNKSIKINLLNEMLRYSFIMTILSVLLVIGSFVESYITPMFMKLLN